MGLYSYKVDNIFKEEGSSSIIENNYSDIFNEFCKQSVILFAETAYNDVIIDYYISENYELITESFSDVLRNIINAIITAVKKFVGKVRDLFKNIIGIFSKNNKDINRLDKEQKDILIDVQNQLKKMDNKDEMIEKLKKETIGYKKYDLFAFSFSNSLKKFNKTIEYQKLIDTYLNDFNIDQFIDYTEANFKHNTYIASLTHSADIFNPPDISEKQFYKMTSSGKYVLNDQYNNYKDFLGEVQNILNEYDYSADEDKFTQIYNKFISILNNVYKYIDTTEVSLYDIVNDNITLNNVSNKQIDILNEKYNSIVNIEKEVVKELNNSQKKN